MGIHWQKREIILYNKASDIIKRFECQYVIKQSRPIVARFSLYVVHFHLISGTGH